MGGICENGKRQSRKEYHNTEYYLPITQTVNQTVFLCKW